MKKVTASIFGILFTCLTFGQTINIQAGSSFSKLDYQIAPNFLNQTVMGYSCFAGVDYFDKKFINLSSNLGVIRKGGESNVEETDMYGNVSGERLVKATLDYLSVNTMMQVKYPIMEKYIPFISVGPRLDYMIASKFIDSGVNKSIFGLIMGGGLKYNLDKLQFGLRGDYYLNFTNIWNKTNYKIEDKTFTVNVSVGYKLL